MITFKGDWFFDRSFLSKIAFGYKIKERIFETRSSYQKIEVFKSYLLGKILALDGIIQLSEKYEFIYHEMISHIPLFYHQNPKRILIIGGGDGGVVREVLKHPVKEVILVELDKKVVDVSLKFFPSLGLKNSLKDERMTLFFKDGKNFIKDKKEKFDIVIVDSTDPFKFSASLFKLDFYRRVKKILKRKGIFITQSGNFLDQLKEMRKTIFNLKKIFPFVKVHLFYSPDYPGSEFSITLGGEINFEKFSLKEIKEKKRKRKILNLKYYSPQVHLSSGVLSKFHYEKIFRK